MPVRALPSPPTPASPPACFVFVLPHPGPAPATALAMAMATVASARVGLTLSSSHSRLHSPRAPLNLNAIVGSRSSSLGSWMELDQVFERRAGGGLSGVWTVRSAAARVRAAASGGGEKASRREVTLAGVLASLSLAATTAGVAEDAEAVSSSRRALRSEQVPESEYKTLPNGLKYYDVKVGGGKAAQKGSRVAVHYVAKWKGLTFMTSRQGMGVTGGTPYGFDVGASEYGLVLKGLDYGVEGMRVGGQRLLIVPPELAYGNKGVQEIPPNATLQFDIELLSIKQDNFGSRVKIVEG